MNQHSSMLLCTRMSEKEPKSRKINIFWSSLALRFQWSVILWLIYFIVHSLSSLVNNLHVIGAREREMVVFFLGSTTWCLMVFLIGLTFKSTLSACNVMMMMMMNQWSQQLCNFLFSHIYAFFSFIVN